jgi:hypothetical protein
MVQTRVAGTDAAAATAGAGFHRGLGAALARLHTITEVAGLPAEPAEDPDEPLRLISSYTGLIDHASADWLTAWLTALRRPPLPPVLLHGDVAPQNLMVAPDGTLHHRSPGRRWSPDGSPVGAGGHSGRSAGRRGARPDDGRQHGTPALAAGHRNAATRPAHPAAHRRRPGEPSGSSRRDGGWCSRTGLPQQEVGACASGRCPCWSV